MPVPVMDIGIVRMPVHQRQVPMHMHVRLHAVPVEVVRVPVVRVVPMGMRMFERLVRVFVFMALAQVQPHAQSH